MSKGLLECKCITSENKYILLTLLKKETKFIKDSLILIPKHNRSIYQSQIQKLEELHRNISTIKEC